MFDLLYHPWFQDFTDIDMYRTKTKSFSKESHHSHSFEGESEEEEAKIEALVETPVMSPTKRRKSPFKKKTRPTLPTPLEQTILDKLRNQGFYECSKEEFSQKHILDAIFKHFAVAQTSANVSILKGVVKQIKGDIVILPKLFKIFEKIS